MEFVRFGDDQFNMLPTLLSMLSKFMKKTSILTISNNRATKKLKKLKILHFTFIIFILFLLFYFLFRNATFLTDLTFIFIVAVNYVGRIKMYETIINNLFL